MCCTLSTTSPPKILPKALLHLIHFDTKCCLLKLILKFVLFLVQSIYVRLYMINNNKKNYMVLLYLFANLLHFTKMINLIEDFIVRLELSLIQMFSYFLILHYQFYQNQSLNQIPKGTFYFVYFSETSTLEMDFHSTKNHFF